MAIRLLGAHGIRLFCTRASGLLVVRSYQEPFGSRKDWTPFGLSFAVVALIALIALAIRRAVIVDLLSFTT